MKKYLGFIWIGIIIVVICICFYFIIEHEFEGTKLSMHEWYQLCKNFPITNSTEQPLLCVRAERNRKISLLGIGIGIIVWSIGLMAPTFREMRKKK